MDLTNLAFSRDWTNPEDFKSVETDEGVVRADYQFLHNETRDYINNTLIPAIRAISGMASTVVSQTLDVDRWDPETLTQTVVAAGVKADESAQLIQVLPASASQAVCSDCGVRCTAQAADTLVYSAERLPTVSLTMYAVISEVAV